MRLARLAIVGVLSVGIAWGCGSSDNNNNGNGTDAGADSSAGMGGSTAGTGGTGTGGSTAGTNGGGSGGSTAGTGGSTAGSAGAGGSTAGTGGSTAGTGGTTDAGLDASANGGTGGTDSGPPPIQCTPTGAQCSNGSQCCSKLCNPNSGLCEPGQCFDAGAPCDTPDDCCSTRCEGNVCQATKCVDDGASCSNGGQCCSGTCTSGSCAALNDTCSTAGNSCAGDGDCCSHYCDNGVCNVDISWCTQTGDICSTSEACCSGHCTIATGESVGTCDPIASGAGCSGKSAEGEVCPGFGDCAQCCSKLCTPDPTSGRFVCAPTLGCKTEGALCRADTDCCGYAGSDLPGDGNGECIIEPGAAVGFCKTTSCIPQGQVCKYEGTNPDYICDQPTQDPNNCCSAVGNSGRCDANLLCNGFEPCPAGSSEGDSCSLCQVDTLGIPRCNGLTACREPGETCSSAADCCNQIPCVPDDQGILRCLEVPDAGCVGDGGSSCTACVPEGGSCSGDADCCAGYICIKSPGSVIGVCGVINPPPPPPPDSGAGGTGGSGGTGSGGSGGTPPTCSAYGQGCSVREDCCNYDVDPNYGCFGGVCKINPN